MYLESLNKLLWLADRLHGFKHCIKIYVRFRKNGVFASCVLVGAHGYYIYVEWFLSVVLFVHRMEVF